jgi:CheY-like chemotaxis protein
MSWLTRLELQLCPCLSLADCRILTLLAAAFRSWTRRTAAVKIARLNAQMTKAAILNKEKTILVADDDELLRQLLEHRLEAGGYRVVTASNGQEALERVRIEQPDLVVLDAMMPVLDGFAVLNTLQDDPELRGIPVLMLTALKGERDIVGALG